jgi:hypothetical protein
MQAEQIFIDLDSIRTAGTKFRKRIRSLISVTSLMVLKHSLPIFEPIIRMCGAGNSHIQIYAEETRCCTSKFFILNNMMH